MGTIVLVCVSLGDQECVFVMRELWWCVFLLILCLFNPVYIIFPELFHRHVHFFNYAGLIHLHKNIWKVDGIIDILVALQRHKIVVLDSTSGFDLIISGDDAWYLKRVLINVSLNKWGRILEVQLFLSLIGALFVHVNHFVSLFNRVDEIIRLLKEVLFIMVGIDDVEFLI